MNPFGFPIDPFQWWLDDPANKPIIDALSRRPTDPLIMTICNPSGPEPLRDALPPTAQAWPAERFQE